MDSNSRRFDFDPVRFVIVGLGMGKLRARQIQETDGVTLAGVADINEERAKAVGEEFNVEWTTELDPWLQRDDIDVIFIMTPTGLHERLAVSALEAGGHVLLTKPMEANLPACDRMIEIANRTGRILAVDFEMRCYPPVELIKECLTQGGFGQLLGGSVELKIWRSPEYFARNGGWRGTREFDGGGAMSNQAIHYIDQIIYLIGMPQRVSMRAWNQLHDIECEDLASALWQYEDGTVIQFYATTAYPGASWYFDVKLHGTEGAVWYAGGGPYSVPIQRWFTNGSWQSEAPHPAEPAWNNCMQNLADAIRTGAPLVCDALDGRRSRLALDAMYASAAEDGAWTDLGHLEA
jgi:predicted dehydrogenase